MAECGQRCRGDAFYPRSPGKCKIPPSGRHRLETALTMEEQHLESKARPVVPSFEQESDVTHHQMPIPGREDVGTNGQLGQGLINQLEPASGIHDSEAVVD